MFDLIEPIFYPVPKVIAFQYNAETLWRTMSPWSLSRKEGGTYWRELQSSKQMFDPSESFVVEVVFDAIDTIGKTESHQVTIELTYEKFEYTT